MPDVLFAPWRYEYLVSDKETHCIFCAAAASENDEESLVVHRGRRVFVVLNRYPYTNGHVMVAPYAHEARAQKILVSAYKTDGLNVGVNFGSAAGAGVASHYHVHVVPRWLGDTNFMTVTAGTRVVPEELGPTQRRLAPLFANAEGS